MKKEFGIFGFKFRSQDRYIYKPYFSLDLVRRFLSKYKIKDYTIINKSKDINFYKKYVL